VSEKPAKPPVTNQVDATVSTIDVETRTKHPDDIPVGLFPAGVAVTPNGKTAFITNAGRGVGSGGVS
jgi:YVTN family beta-propeller protein